MQGNLIETAKLTPTQTRFQIVKMEDRYREQVLAMASTLVQLVDLRDCYTGGHSTRVAEYSHRMALELGLLSKITMPFGVALFAVARKSARFEKNKRN